VFKKNLQDNVAGGSVIQAEKGTVNEKTTIAKFHERHKKRAKEGGERPRVSNRSQRRKQKQDASERGLTMEGKA